ncbi:hypothetical protein [Companilactobacillus sp. FL22-1]|uniref:hypothetical protein n=1 Tax=Companilactobacillus sp. FL22-1 TaxID=3373892 RepID=UPI003754206E
MEEELITLTRSELQSLMSGNAKALITAKPSTATLLFRNSAIDSSDIRLINEKYGFSRINNLASYGGSTFSKHQTFNYDGSFERKRLINNGPYSNGIHDLIRKLTLAIMGETLNKNLSYEDWNEARNDYIQIKRLFLKLYQKRLDNLFDD